jgi:multicomponent Na+:H+ antiporter subunit G
MDLLFDIFTILCLVVGCFFSFTGAVGVLRMPDFFSRIHPAGKNDTMGVLMICLGLMTETLKYEYGYLVAAKLLLIVLFVFVTAPVASHAIAKAAFLGGLKPWTGEEDSSD